MKILTFNIRPLSPFGTPLAGDTIFGQLCWVIRNIQGTERLAGLLEGYTAGQPFAVVSDAFPAGFVSRPDIPADWLGLFSGSHTRSADRKEYKKLVWLPLTALEHASDKWGSLLTSGEALPTPWEVWQSHNQIDRRTGTTGTDTGFDPFVVQQWQYPQDTELHVHVCYEPERIESELLEEAFQSMGQTGYGGNASSGMGRFEAWATETEVLPSGLDYANAWLTLAPCAPQGQNFDQNRSWYRVSTRFGRHGDVGALSAVPFKVPILLAQRGAVFSPQKAFALKPFLGQGLGGRSDPISRFIPETVHQGYAPVLGIQLTGRSGRSP